MRGTTTQHPPKHRAFAVPPPDKIYETPPTDRRPRDLGDGSLRGDVPGLAPAPQEQFGIDVATLLGGVIVTEQVFGLSGLGRMSVQAVTNSDEPIIIAVVLLAAVFVAVANIVVDVLYAVLDPRIRLS